MALGQTNISVAVVQSAIGVFSTSSVGGLIAKALSGGVGGYAFYINETYGTTGRRDGYLIPGAKPHWNMWSNKIPAEWNDDTGDLSLRLKRNALNLNGGYDFRLHDFRGYDHSAHTPSLVSTTAVDALSGALSVGFNIYLSQVAFPINITHILARLTIGTYVEDKLIPISSLQNPNTYTPVSFGYDVTGIDQSVTSGQIKFYGSNINSLLICTLDEFFTVATGSGGTRPFTITHVVQAVPKLSVFLDTVWDANIELNAYIYNPYSSDGLTINIPYGITTMPNIYIRIEAYSETITSASVDVYFHAQGVTSFVGNYNISASPSTEINNLPIIYTSLSNPAAANEVYSFSIDSINY